MSAKEKLLIVEDDAQISSQLKWALADDYDVHLANDESSALRILRIKKPAVVTLDLGLPPRPDEAAVGLELLGKILELQPNTKIVVVTGNGERENALRATNQGAWDYYSKPINIDELKIILSRAFHVSTLERENTDLHKELEGKQRFDEMIGSSAVMNEIFADIRKVARSDVSILVIGESGTGKELIARAIHNKSDRREEPFVAINCGAIPETLLEAELFGHEKGAYTGAHMQRKGKVEYANGGTLFLDEIGELPASLQVKLLRFLQERTIERIGGRDLLEVDVRIIAASHKNLKDVLATGEFREDLYYRLGVVTIEVPPLRNRSDDVPLLAHYFVRKCCQEMNRPQAKLNSTALQAIMKYDWPGNVRELENKIMRAVVMGQGRIIRGEDLAFPCELLQSVEKQTLKEAREKLERDFVSRALLANNWNVARAAEQIGVTRPTMYDLIKKYELRKEDHVYGSEA
jgi:two-component system NtrC family response regulator